MRLCLASMPWLAVDTPSLAIGILHRRVVDACPDVEVVDYPGTLRWAEYLLANTDGRVTPGECGEVANDGLAYGLGDWIFAGSLYDDPTWRVAELRHAAREWDFDIELAERLRALADGFVDEAVAELLAARPDVVGFTTTFMQTVSSLAVASRIKRLRPEVRVVFGGANCDGPMGHAIHRNHRFVDYVVRGEGELAFPAMLERIRVGVEPADIGGVCWWDGGRSIANREARTVVPPGVVPVPDYDQWFAALDRSPVREYLSPYLFLEGSRGCWWGERHQCTFCGLNGTHIGYRGKAAERFWSELAHLVQRHQVLDVMTADNIMDMAYYRDLLPRLVESGWDLRLQFEAKANVPAEKIAQFAAAGVCAVQFGIENLSSRVLKIMDKGVTGTTNVRVLRDSEAHHLSAAWNYLYGFPGETPADYWPVIEQMPALVHLQPPHVACRIALQRFSPYFERPELGFPRRTPAAFYQYVYDLPPSELADLAYLFDTDDAGISGEVEAALSEAITRWQRDYPLSSLFFTAGPGDALTIHDHRLGWPRREHVLTGWRRKAYQALDRGRTEQSLRRRLAEVGCRVEADALHGWLADCLRDGLVFAEAGSYVALATADVAVHLARETPVPVVTG